MWVTVRFGGTAGSMDAVHGNSQGCKPLNLVRFGSTTVKVASVLVTDE